MYHRNQTSALIELGRLDEAEESLQEAVWLESDHPNLEELRKELEGKRGE